MPGATMKWIVSVDAAPHCRGALHFSKWWSEATRTQWRDAFVPVHVLDAERLRMALRYRHLDELVNAERAAALKQIREVLPGEGAAVEVVQALTVDAGVERERSRRGATGIIIARIAPRGSRRVFRLGGVARRLLGASLSPVVVVPPDVTASNMEDGPVVALSSLAENSVEACRLARCLADQLERDLAIVHVTGTQQARSASGREIPAGPFIEREHGMARWFAQHDLWPDVATVVDGEFPAAAIAFAEARRVSLIVVGAHGSTGVKASIERKPWRWLAAHARQPILVVPGCPRAQAAWVDAGQGDHAQAQPES